TTCFAACGQQCNAHCEVSCADLREHTLELDDGLDDAQEFGRGDQGCQVSCGSSCMGDSGAGCELSDHLSTCLAACRQQRDAHREVSCGRLRDNLLELDDGLADAQEGRRGGRDDDDDDFFEKCKRKYKRNWKKYCKKRGDWRRDYYEK